MRILLTAVATLLIAAILLCTAEPGKASTQISDRVCRLSIDGWLLHEKDGRAWLIDPRWAKPAKWYVSAPTIKDAKGRFLACDPAGLEPTVHLVEKAGKHARWLFEITSQTRPEEVTVSARTTMKSGRESMRFRMMAASGPYKGWYLGGVEALSRAQEKRNQREAVLSALKLVRHQKEAAELDYLEGTYRIKH